MTAFDDFVKEINTSLFVHCLGQKIQFKTQNGKIIKGDFISINPDDNCDIIYHDDLSFVKERIHLIEGKKSTLNFNQNKISSVDDNDILYFKIEDVNLNPKVASSNDFI